MNPLLLSGLFDVGKSLIARFFPDPAQAAAAQMELVKMQQSGELAQLAAATDLAKAQIAVNQAEAASGNLFIAGWRPAVGWVCVVALCYQYIVAPLAPWLLNAFGVVVPNLPGLDDTLWQLLAGMLGLGAFRTVEKVKGAEGNR
jgi:hypothetical protein